MNGANEITKEVKNSLLKLFDKYKERGVLSIYLYGSITGPDFNPSKSDIDSIVIANHEVNIDLENEMQSFLANNFPNIPRFGVRILYVEELITLTKMGSNLAFFIPPTLLLLDFPYWDYVVGKKFSRSDFPPVSYQEGIKDGYDVLRIWNWEDVNNVTSDKTGNYLKVIGRILWTIDGSTGKEYKYSYSHLAERDDKYKQIANLILQNKKDGWSEINFLPNKQIFQNFVNDIKKFI